VNGFSSSLPEEVQYKALRKVAGFENMKMFRPGYAIEYDFFPPTQLDISLETKKVKGLFFAGQINGTTGYEEAACQGLMAGLNAHQSVVEEEPLVIKRSEAYIGVLIDDLVNKGTKEPYRMFTSRAEYRVLLRQDNADIRLTPIAQKLGIKGSEERMEKVNEKIEAGKAIERYIRNYSVSPDQVNGFLASVNSAALKQKVKLHSVLMRPHVGLAEVNMKYEGYLKREQEMVDKMNRLEEVKLTKDFDYAQIKSLSAEAREKLGVVQPKTIGQASRISGVSPADISVLLVHMGR